MSQHGCPERLSNRSKGFQEDGSGQATMEVLVETLTGTAFEMTVSPSDTIFAIKSKIFRVEGIPVSQQHLVYNLRELEDSLSLREHAIGDGARLRLVVGLRGGPVATRRLPPPEPWRDIERLLHSNRDESEWSGGGGSGCKVTVLVFREGERVNMVRVRENRDGTYSPLEHAKCSTESSSLTHLLETEPDDGLSGSLQENAVTMGKMLDLRRRMENLSVRRRQDRNGDKHDIQKTRSEETLSVASLLDEAGADPFGGRTYTPYSEEDGFAPLYDGHYTRYSYECAPGDRYTLLPPIGARAEAERARAQDEERLLSDALAGSILVKARDARDEGAAILEECLDGEDCMRPHPAKSLAPIPAAEYGPLVGGEAGGWRARAFGSSSQLAACGGGGAGAEAAHARSASALHVRARAAPRPLAPHAHAPHPLHPLHPLHPPPLSDALFCSSTSDLEKLKRNRILPALSRHRNREHLHLSDEGLDLTPPRGLEAVGSERRQRRIDKIAESEHAPLPALPALSQRLYRYEDSAPLPAPAPAPPVEAKEPVVKKQGAAAGGGAVGGGGGGVRVRCGWCRRRLSIATEHSCRCGGRFCAPHRYAEVHGCAFDYKALARDAEPPAPAALLAPKLPKI